MSISLNDINEDDDMNNVYLNHENNNRLNNNLNNNENNNRINNNLNNNENNNRINNYLSQAYGFMEVFVNPLRKKITNLKNEIKNLKNQIIEKDNIIEEFDKKCCSVCFINESNIIFIPCGHLCMCNQCYNKYLEHNMNMTLCPICRSYSSGYNVYT